MADFVTVAQVSALPSGSATQVSLGGQKISLWNVGGTIYAINDICTHEECDISDGGAVVNGAQVECPCHGAIFDLRTGEAKALPAVEGLRTYPVRVEGDAIQVAM